MRVKLFFILICGALLLSGCSSGAVQNANAPVAQQKTNAAVDGTAVNANASENKTAGAEDKGGKSSKNEPRTVRDFFNLLPQKYFTLEGCEPAKDKNCERARAEYVKSYLEVEDTANGYWKSSCDGGQSCLRMALFKRPDGAYVVGVHTLHEADEINHFLEYRSGEWTDISAGVVPEFSSRNIYELPRYGTTVEVYQKVFPEKTFSERGSKIYELEWKNGKFRKK